MRLGLSLSLGASGASAWTPAKLSGLALWLRADKGVTLNGSTVETWADQSGNGRDATQATAANQPTFRAAGHARSIGDKPTIDFDGAGSDFLDIPDLSSLTAGEVFVVARQDFDPTGATYRGFWYFSASDDYVPWSDGNIYDGFGSTVRKTVGNPTPSLASPFLYNVTTASGEWTARLNGTQIFTTATNTVSFNTTPKLGQTKGLVYYLGVFSEFILFDRKLETAERALMNAYVASRYGFSVA